MTEPLSKDLIKTVLLQQDPTCVWTTFQTFNQNTGMKIQEHENIEAGLSWPSESVAKKMM